MVDAGYSFLPWLRIGMAGGLGRLDGTLIGSPRAAVKVTLAIDAAGDPRPVTAALSLFGPGEVAGIDPRLIIRQAPKPDEIGAEPNYFPMIEFSDPDFPWRYTPTGANALDRVPPWLVLAVLTPDEIAEEAATGADG